MKNIFKHSVASFVGTLTFLLLMKIEDLLDFIGITERNEFKYPPHVTISDILLSIVFFLLILTLQLSLVNPIFNYLKKIEKYNNRNLLIVAAVLSITLGTLFGLTLGERRLGTSDIIVTMAIGIGIFSTQYLANFLSYIGIERRMKKR
ncbi:MAG: hypothetical protein ABJQ37_03455 [Reichenbachiella sp.]|uniref:hypothetical protein n=2 Tax=Reichenbachiella sp. TaxID=2184521 RepID=UPI0032987495